MSKISHHFHHRWHRCKDFCHCHKKHISIASILLFFILLLLFLLWTSGPLSTTSTTTTTVPHHVPKPHPVIPRPLPGPGPITPKPINQLPTTTTTTTVPSAPPVVAPPTTQPPVAITSTSVYAEWSMVAHCEEGGWVGYAGPGYPDSLGIDTAAWYGNGGGSDVSPAAQIAVAQRVIDSIIGKDVQGTTVYAGFVPDQGYCRGSW